MNAFVDDREAVHHFLDSGDRQGFSLLYCRYRDKVFRKCLDMLKKEGAAKDAAQEIFIQVFLKLPQFRREARFSSWLFIITQNYCLDLLRKEKQARDQLSSIGNLDMIRQEEQADPYRIDRQLAELNLVMREMPAADKRILQMKFWDRMSIRAIAKRYRVSEGAVKMRIKRAKARARQIRTELAAAG